MRSPAAAADVIKKAGYECVYLFFSEVLIQVLRAKEIGERERVVEKLIDCQPRFD